MVEIGTKLKELRLNKNLTQRQVAELVGISKAMISSYELNTREPSLTILMKLASLYRVSVDSLLGLEREDMISVKGLNAKQITIVQSVIDSYRDMS